MRVITVEKIKEYIEDKYNKDQKLSLVKVEGKEKHNRAYVIHDHNVECPRLYLDSNNEVRVVNDDKRTHCILPETVVNEALGGHLIIDGAVATARQLDGYWYKI
jgi:hypothetical protein